MLLHLDWPQPEVNTLAYFVSTSAMKKKEFKSYFGTYFFWTLMLHHNKLERFSLTVFYKLD